MSEVYEVRPEWQIIEEEYNERFKERVSIQNRIRGSIFRNDFMHFYSWSGAKPGLYHIAIYTECGAFFWSIDFGVHKSGSPLNLGLLWQLKKVVGENHIEYLENKFRYRYTVFIDETVMTP